MEWQPIETAPKDGSMIVLGNEFIVWMGKYMRVYPSGYVPACPWTFDMLNTNYAVGDVISLLPTHWMPLPTPPVQP